MTQQRHRRKTTRSAASRPQVSELESHLGFWLRYVSNHVSGEFQKAVEANGVSVSEWVALRRLFLPGGASPAELVAALGMTKGAISKIVSHLQEQGLVERTQVATDRRAQRVVLTAAGSVLVPRLAALADQNDDAFFGYLSRRQRDELMHLMQDIVRRNQFVTIPVK
jgi:DNA-binding MarR family transcriptional regulator